MMGLEELKWANTNPEAYRALRKKQNVESQIQETKAKLERLILERQSADKDT